jgi:hypothetical protein
LSACLLSVFFHTGVFPIYPILPEYPFLFKRNTLRFTGVLCVQRQLMDF